MHQFRSVLTKAALAMDGAGVGATRGVVMRHSCPRGTITTHDVQRDLAILLPRLARNHTATVLALAEGVS